MLVPLEIAWSSKHKVAGEKTLNMMKAISLVARTDKRTLVISDALREGLFGFSPGRFYELLGCGVAIIAISSLDAYFQIDGLDFIDTLKETGMNMYGG